MNRISVIQDRHPELTDNQCRSLLLLPYQETINDDLCPEHRSHAMDFAAVSISHLPPAKIYKMLNRFPFNGDGPLKCDCCDEIIQPEKDDD